MCHLLPTRTPRVFPKELLLRKLAPGCISSREIPPQGQDFAHVLVEFQEFPASQFLPPVHVPQDDSLALEQTDSSPQFGINCRIYESANNVIIRKRSIDLSEKADIFTQ